MNSSLPCSTDLTRRNKAAVAEEIALWGDENGSTGNGLARLDDMVFVHGLAPEHSRFRFAVATSSFIEPMRLSLR
jgi:hypothetical protein